jgi:hypothetical protein
MVCHRWIIWLWLVVVVQIIFLLQTAHKLVEAALVGLEPELLFL